MPEVKENSLPVEQEIKDELNQLMKIINANVSDSNVRKIVSLKIALICAKVYLLERYSTIVESQLVDLIGEEAFVDVLNNGTETALSETIDHLEDLFDAYGIHKEGMLS